MTTGDEQQLRPPWERLLPANGKRGESDVAFAAFCAYCKLLEGEDNLRRLADTLGKSRTLVERWSVRHFWQQRRSAWRDHLARIEREKVEQLWPATGAPSPKSLDRERPNGPGMNARLT